jgi:hypothetical protein
MVMPRKSVTLFPSNLLFLIIHFQKKFHRLTDLLYLRISKELSCIGFKVRKSIHPFINKR